MKENRWGRDNGPASGGLFEPFDLSVNLGPEDIPFLSATSRAGSLHGIPRRHSSLPDLPDLLDMVFDYLDAVKFAERQPNPELSQVLREMVFGDVELKHLFQATRGVAADRGRQLLVRILASPHLAALPWELLPDPDQDASYLAFAPDTHLVRLARGLYYPARTALLEAPLNLLIVLSSPAMEDNSEDRDDLTFDIFEVKRSLLSELAPLEEAGLLHIEVEDRPTLDNLRRRIGAQRRGFHLFHYVGHALPEQLILEDHAGFREEVASSHFMEILRLCPDLRLAVFAGCETARPARDPASLDTEAAAGSRHLLSLADYCVQKACPAVIGMQAVLPFSTERVFTRFFYQALASGYSIAEAMRLARGAIHGDERIGGSLLDWSVPSLFVGSSEPGLVVLRGAAPVKPAPGAKTRQIKLGLPQGDALFCSRDLQLRQAVDIMTGERPERVLLITGAAGVGKTAMVDRVLEELGNKAHVLAVNFDRLAPEVVEACKTLEAGGLPSLERLAQLAPDHALNRLCELVLEILRDSGGIMRSRDAKCKIDQWWEQRLVQDLVKQRVALVIEGIDLLDRLQYGLFEKIIALWLGKRVDTELKASSAAQLQDNIDLQSAWLDELNHYLAALPKRPRNEIAQMLGDHLDRLMAQKILPKSAKPQEPVSDEIVIAALQVLEQVRVSLDAALRAVAERRSNVRILLTAVEKPRTFLDLPEEHVFEMRLVPLSWLETWQFIRRKLPGLLTYGDDSLSRFWSKFGARFERWEELERRVLGEHDKKVDLEKLARQIAPRPAARPSGAGTLPAKRGQRALRLAVAGPYLAGGGAMADALSRLAVQHGIGGRAVAVDEAGALASFIKEPSPFTETGMTDRDHILEWLQAVFRKQPDIILLDYGSLKSPEEITKSRFTDQERILLRIMKSSSLLIAAGGHEQQGHLVTTPSGYPEVLGVGPLDNHGRLRPYAAWHPELGKPDLFMADDLSATALAAALNFTVLSKEDSPKEGFTWGSSFAALHAVATATLVWSILPELPPRGIRALLMEASKPIDGQGSARSLTMEDAIALARVRVVERTLGAGAVSLQTLSAITGLKMGILLETLQSLINEDQPRVAILSPGRFQRFQWIGPPK